MKRRRRRRRLGALLAAVVGFGAVLVGIHQELLHVGAAYEGTIETGWGGALNHEERLLASLGAFGVVVAVVAVATRWKRAAVVPSAAGAVVLFYVARAVLHYALDPGLYTEVSVHGDTMLFVLGAEPFSLAVGGGALVVAGVLGWRSNATPSSDGDAAGEEPSTA